MPRRDLKVLYVAYECAPFFKLGGLGDVAGSLPKALTELGVDIRVVMPYYQGVSKFEGVKLVKAGIKFQILNPQSQLGTSFKFQIDLYKSYLPNSKAPIYFIDNKEWFGVKNIFDEREKERFVLFSILAGKLPEIIGWEADIIHGNDWQTGPLVKIQDTRYKIQDTRYKKQDTRNKIQNRVKTIYTIHNLAYKGMCPVEILEKYGFGRGDFSELDDKGQVNLMREAILAADIINTVSPTYAREILTKEFGAGMEDVLIKRKKDLYGIVNGLDYGVFNPEQDKQIKARYGLKNIERKLDNKLYLQKINKLPVRPEAPVIGMVSRLASQKGFDLIQEIFEELMKEDLQLIILGSGDKKMESAFIELQKKYKDKFSPNLMFSPKLASQIYAGADMFLMPSKYEPCGLGQLIAMRYGTVPIVRGVGGLYDTVVGAKIKELNIDFKKQETRNLPRGKAGKKQIISNFQLLNINKATGFSFEQYDSNELLKTIRQTLLAYQDKTEWKRLQINGMKQDWSWVKSAGEYLKLYRKLLK